MKALPSPPPGRTPGHPQGRRSRPPRSPPRGPSPAPAPPGRAAAPGQLQPLPPGREPGSPRGSEPPARPGTPEGAPGLTAGPGCRELLGNLPASPRAKAPAHQRQAGAVGTGDGHQRPAPLPHGPPTAPWNSCRPMPGSPAGTPGRGAAPPRDVAPSPSLWQPPPAPGVFSAPGPPWEPGRVPPHSAQALWAAFVAGVEPSWQPLPPRPPRPVRVTAPAGGGTRLRPARPLRTPPALGWLQRSQAPVATKAAPSERCAPLGLPSPCQGTWDPRATCHPHCPPPNPGSSLGDAHQGGIPEQHSAGAGVPCPLPNFPSLRAAFPIRASVSPRENLPRAKGLALRGCWPRSRLTSTNTRPPQHPSALAPAPAFWAEAGGATSPHGSAAICRQITPETGRDGDTAAGPHPARCHAPHRGPRGFSLCRAPSAGPGPRVWAAGSTGAFSREEKGSRPE